MAKLTQVHLHGKSYQMPANFRVLSIVTDEVCDPFKVMSQLGGLHKTPEFPLTQKQCITLLCIGVRAAGANEPDADLQEAIYEIGPERYVPLAMAYLASFCAGEERAQRTPKAGAKTGAARR